MSMKSALDPRFPDPPLGNKAPFQSGFLNKHSLWCHEIFLLLFLQKPCSETFVQLTFGAVDLFGSSAYRENKRSFPSHSLSMLVALLEDFKHHSRYYKAGMLESHTSTYGPMWGTANWKSHTHPLTPLAPYSPTFIFIFSFSFSFPIFGILELKAEVVFSPSSFLLCPDDSPLHLIDLPSFSVFIFN